MASTHWASEALREYEAAPEPAKLVDLLTRVVAALEELDYEKADRPSDEMW